MLQRYVEIYNQLLAVVEMEDSTVTMYKNEHFARQVYEFSDMLAEIEVVTKELQRKGAYLSDCRFTVNISVEVMSASQLYVMSAFYSCQLGTR